MKIISQSLKALLNNRSDRVQAANPPILTRRAFVNAIFEEKLPFRVIIDAEKCPLSVADYMNVKQDANGHKLKEVVKDRETKETYQLYGHTSDANDYFICSILEAEFRRYSEGRV